MAYEAMLAGLEMKPFWDGIKVKNLEPSEVFNDSMTRFYTLLEYTGLLINWEDHSESRPPLLTDPTDKGKAPQRLFSRSLRSFFRVYPISNKRHLGLGTANAPDRFTTTKNCMHLFVCTSRNLNFPRFPSHPFPSHGQINLGGHTVGRMLSTCFAFKGMRLQTHPEGSCVSSRES